MSNGNDKRTIEITEGQVVRWLVYVGFFFCTVSLVTSLTASGPWIGFLLGAIAFGVPAVKFYVQHEDAAKAARSQAGYQQTHGRARDQDWDMSGDPTEPPQ
jgi:hypothetical protein